MEKIAADDALKREILSHARLSEKEFNALREGQAQMLENQEKMMRSLKISSSLKAILDPLNFDLEINGAVERFCEAQGSGRLTISITGSKISLTHASL